MAFKRFSKEQFNLFGDFAFPKGGYVLSLGPVLIATRARKPVPNTLARKPGER